MNGNENYKEKILLVDDTPAILDMVRTILDQQGYQVLIATSGEKAISKAELSHPSLILLDIMMPDMNGYETCQLLKSNIKTQDIPIIFLSALADTFDKVKALKSGAVDYITKPINAEELLARIETHLTINRLQVSLRLNNQILEDKIKARTIELENANENLLSLNQVLEETIEELKVSKERAEESDRLKTAFLANMSHEIRTPMNAVIGFADLLDDEELDFKKRFEYITYIKDNSTQLLSIINDIIDISRIEAGITNIFKSNVMIKSLLMDIYSSFEHLAKNKQLEIKLTYNLNENESIETDSAKLRQIISNLLSNSLKFTEKGYIELGTFYKENSVIFFVKDTGIGIAQELHAAIFEPFRQAELSYTRKYGGTGLGLAISKTYANILGGEIWLESEYGKGAIFYIKLPYTSKINAENSETKKAKDKFSWLDKTILVAEDETTNYLFLAELLSKTKANILHAENGEIACVLVQQHPEIDLILMDIKMPIMNGIEATKMIKKLRPELPIIAQTAYAMSEDKHKAIDSGCNDYISKPIRKELLLEMINKYL